MSNEVVKTVYRTLLDGEVEYEGPSKEQAIRTWDSLTLVTPPTEGGIEVQQFRTDGAMVRDGWLLHLSKSGHVYLSPRP